MRGTSTQRPLQPAALAHASQDERASSQLAASARALHRFSAANCHTSLHTTWHASLHPSSRLHLHSKPIRGTMPRAHIVYHWRLAPPVGRVRFEECALGLAIVRRKAWRGAGGVCDNCESLCTSEDSMRWLLLGSPFKTAAVPRRRRPRKLARLPMMAGLGAFEAGGVLPPSQHGFTTSLNH